MNEDFDQDEFRIEWNYPTPEKNTFHHPANSRLAFVVKASALLGKEECEASVSLDNHHWAAAVHEVKRHHSGCDLRDTHMNAGEVKSVVQALRKALSAGKSPRSKSKDVQVIDESRVRLALSDSERAKIGELLSFLEGIGKHGVIVVRGRPTLN